MKEKNYFVGLDVGTTGAKAVVVGLNGNTVGNAYEEYEVLKPQALWAEQWPDIWLEAGCVAIRAALQMASIPSNQVAGLGVSSLYGGSGIPCDQDMKPLHPCIIWMDRRATAETEWVKEHIGASAIFEVTANYTDSYYGFTKMLWLKNNRPEVWRRTKWLVTPNAYIIHRLTGQLSMDYSSAGNVGGVFNMRKRDWSSELLQEMGIPRAFFPESLVSSSDIVGRVNQLGSMLTGLAVGTPVCAGGVDASVATLGTGVFEQGDHVAILGTALSWGFIHEGENFNPHLISMPHVAEPQKKTYTFGGVATAGALIKWFRDNFVPLQPASSGSGEDDKRYSLLDEEASRIDPGSNRLLVYPYFMGERAPIWNASARGTVHGLTLFHNRGHIYRALLESIGYALRHCMQFAELSDVQLNRDMKLVGGGSRSNLWTQILADITGYRTVRTQGAGEAALGDALLAAVGVGAADFSIIDKWIQFDCGLEPDKHASSVYNEYFKRYLSLYDGVSDQ